ncbi:hypothetical protein OGAPHI_001691 [Ogataea philodendri]|uniref:Uncharacterized protein n=1 Tax=Ogataea philodendri TaxID=1378263 RepID=A0A9P8P9M0_9ASCO|nr:uncharacterized protein OGAPHI_001691 [Ogataea philodendri]KAH3667937.1 hypothetical protein OGAPHI_001691 [Ogataea philodendri]
MPTYFIAGASRGIGLELTKQLSNDKNNTVIASYRTSAPELFELAETDNVKTVVLDINDQNSIESLPQQLSGVSIDVIVLNAGIARSFLPVAQTPRQLWIDHFTTNTIGPVMVFQQLQHLLAPSAKAIFISSVAGSIQSFLPLRSSAYGASKAALNFAIKKLSEEHPTIIFLAIHPGMVATETGEDSIDSIANGNQELKAMLMQSSISPEASAANVIRSIHSPSISGRFIRADDQMDIPF